MGAFRGDDKLLLVDEKGVAKTVVPDLSLHFDIIPLIMERWVQERPITAVYFDSEKDRYFIKRFLIENKNKEDNFIGDNAKLIFVSSEWRPVIELVFVKPRGGDPLPNKSINVEDFISIKGFKAIGNQLTTTKIKEVILSDSLPYEEPKEEPLENLDVIDANQINDSDSNDTQTKLEL